MDVSSTLTGVMFTLETLVGATGNLLLLLPYAHSNYTAPKVKPVDTILCHLLFVNSMILLTRGTPQMLYSLGLKNFMDDISCKIVIYSYRILRTVSICVTSLLSTVQAITISPITSPWIWSVKSKSPKAVAPSLVIFWLLSMLQYIHVPFLVGAPYNGTIPPFTWNLGFCYSRTSLVVQGVVNNLHDAFFIGLMVLSSAYILFVLRRHRRQVKHIRGRSQNPKMEADRKAVHIVIKLVMLFCSFYGIDSFINVYSLSLSTVSPLTSDIRVFIASGYALFSPFIIIRFNKKVCNKWRCTIDMKSEQQVVPSFVQSQI